MGMQSREHPGWPSLPRAPAARHSPPQPGGEQPLRLELTAQLLRMPALVQLVQQQAQQQQQSCKLPSNSSPCHLWPQQQRHHLHQQELQQQALRTKPSSLQQLWRAQCTRSLQQHQNIRRMPAAQTQHMQLTRSALCGHRCARR